RCKLCAVAGNEVCQRPQPVEEGVLVIRHTVMQGHQLVVGKAAQTVVRRHPFRACGEDRGNAGYVQRDPLDAFAAATLARASHAAPHMPRRVASSVAIMLSGSITSPAVRVVLRKRSRTSRSAWGNWQASASV